MGKTRGFQAYENARKIVEAIEETSKISGRGYTISSYKDVKDKAGHELGKFEVRSPFNETLEVRVFQNSGVVKDINWVDFAHKKEGEAAPNVYANLAAGNFSKQNLEQVVKAIRDPELVSVINQLSIPKKALGIEEAQVAEAPEVDSPEAEEEMEM